jgi:hypothetical protein
MLAIINQILNLPPEIWQMLLVGIIASPLTQIFKHFTDSEKHWAELILAAIGLIGSFVVYSINSDPLLHDQLAAILAQWGLVGLTAKPFYYIFIKGLWQGLIVPNFGDARELSHELQSAAIPAGGLPIEVSGATSPARLATEELAQPAEFN